MNAETRLIVVSAALFILVSGAGMGYLGWKIGQRNEMDDKAWEQTKALFRVEMEERFHAERQLAAEKNNALNEKVEDVKDLAKRALTKSAPSAVLVPGKVPIPVQVVATPTVMPDTNPKRGWFQ